MLLERLVRSPELLGFDPERLKAVEKMLHRGIEEQLYTAYAYLVMRHGKVAIMGAGGLAQPDATPPVAVQLDTIFDAASLTKTITATLLLQCVEAGQLHLEQPLRWTLPESKETPLGEVTLKQLATHTSGLPSWRDVNETGNALEHILATPLEAEPGTRYAYSDLGYILLGFVLERELGGTLPNLAKKRIFDPLGMERSGYFPCEHLKSHLAATSAPLGQVHDPNARGMGGAAGHAGLYTTVSDLARYLLGLRPPEGEIPLLPPLLSPLTRRLMETNQNPSPLNGHTIGWFAYPSGYLPKGDLLSEKTYAHTGFTGTLLMVDPLIDLGLILLTNRVYYEKQNDGSGVLRLRRLFANAVAGALQRL